MLLAKAQNIISHLAKYRNDMAEDICVKLQTDNSAVLAIPITLQEDPKRTNRLTDKELPTFNTSPTLQDSPILDFPSRDTELPTLEKERIDKELPMCKKSKMETADPNFA